MFCKYCGKPIDEGTMRCRICGRPVGPLEGGNGFWDLKTEKKTEAPAEPEKEKEREPEKESAPAAPAAEGIPTVPAASPADSKNIRELRGQVKKLQEEVKNLTPQKRNGMTAGALLLALLALALGAFILLQMRSLTGRVQEMETQLSGQLPGGGAGQNPGSQEAESTGEKTSEENGGENKWQGFDELTGVRLFSKAELFDGPNKGENDSRGQSIKLGMPENGFEETHIFTARFNGPAGTYRFYWVMVETNDDTMETYFTPLKEEDGYGFRVPNAGDADKVYILSILGEVKEEHLGRYAFVAVDTQTRSAYVSAIVELYDRAEKDTGSAWKDQGAAQSENASESASQENGVGNGG